MTDYYTKRSMSQTTHTVNPVFVGDGINTDIHKQCRGSVRFCGTQSMYEGFMKTFPQVSGS